SSLCSSVRVGAILLRLGDVAEVTSESALPVNLRGERFGAILIFQISCCSGTHHPEMQPAQNPPVIEPGHTYASVTDKISSIVLSRKQPKGWYFGFAIAFALLMLLTYAVTYLLVVGVGIWGINIPVGWGFAIVNFVWWIGFGHAGTLISAILLLLRQKWRTSINRFAEAMTLFAVSCAGLFPLLHMG